MEPTIPGIDRQGGARAYLLRSVDDRGRSTSEAPPLTV
jgi:hypothetical protein